MILNPFRRIVPPGWGEEFSVNAFEFVQFEAARRGGYHKLLVMLLPHFERHDEKAGGPGWSIFGPGWTTRTCDEAEVWYLFVIERTEWGGWRFELVSK